MVFSDSLTPKDALFFLSKVKKKNQPPVFLCFLYHNDFDDNHLQLNLGIKMLCCSFE